MRFTFLKCIVHKKTPKNIGVYIKINKIKIMLQLFLQLLHHF